MQPSLFAARSPLDVSVPAARRSVTSKRAAERLKSSGCRGPQMARLLSAYAAVGVSGLTMSEIAARTQLRLSSICSLRAGAVKQGWVLPLAMTRPAPDTTQDQGVARITTTGLAALAAWEAR